MRSVSFRPVPSKTPVASLTGCENNKPVAPPSLFVTPPPPALHLLDGWSPPPLMLIGRLHDKHIDRPAAPCPASGSGSMPAAVSSFTTLSKRGLILMLPAAAWACVRPGGKWAGQRGGDGPRRHRQEGMSIELELSKLRADCFIEWGGLVGIKCCLCTKAVVESSWFAHLSKK